MKARLAVVILGLAAGPAAAEAIQSYDTYRSWLVACDNTLACVAKGFGDDGVRAELKLERSAGADGPMAATLASEEAFGPADVALDGAPVVLSAPDWTLEASEFGSTLSSTRPAAVRALIARIRNGSKLTLGAGGEVPLHGLAAALLRVDERQGRVGGVTAFVGMGKAPASRVPEAPAVPAIPNHPIDASLAPGEAERLAAGVRSSQAAVFSSEGCQDDRLAIAPDVYALGDARALVLVACLMGAYQGSAIGFLASRVDGTVQRLVLPVPYAGKDPESASSDFLTEGDFNPATGTLFMSARGRGLADCGMSASWIWNGDAFDLSDLSLQQSCGGVGPGEWPTLFRSAQ